MKSSFELRNTTDLPVMLPFTPAGGGTWNTGDVVRFSFRPQFAWALFVVLSCWLFVDAAYAQVQGDPEQTILQTLIKWTPLMLFGAPGEFGGFILNIAVSFIAMALGTFLGLWLGIGQVSPNKLIRRTSWAITQLFRNSPWLVLLFYFMLLLPFTVEIAGTQYDIPGWTKATFALSLPIMANVSEIVRGAIASIPTGQWESAESLAFTRTQTMWQIILPQCVKRMIPPWMNWYCILTMSTPLISILGVSDGMTLTQDALAAEGRSEFLIPMYLWLMSWFFIYSYPIAQWTRRLERRFAVNN
ncbi:amino acid ABC transporter permease [Roseovarius sp. CAU 1744]|uniref:amino acid ABC transporter permease n=1 Tax=Roseovarius sp. CAU 1744 TaxID=3140368 RepID=UPI00325BA1EC